MHDPDAALTRADASHDYPYDEHYPLEDDYLAIGDDDLAYATFDWDDLPPERVASHDALLALTYPEAAARSLDDLDDLQRWAIARVLGRAADWDAYLHTCDRILASPYPDRDPCLAYPELRLERVRALNLLQRFDDALATLDAYDAEPDASPLEGDRARGITLILAQQREAGLELLKHAITAYAERDPELALYLGDDLLHLNHPAEAAEIYRAGLTLASARRLHDLHVELTDALAAIATPSAPSAP